MAVQPTLNELALRGDSRNLEDRWLQVIDDPGARGDMLAALETLTRNGKGEQAATLGWTWLSTVKERFSAADSLELARELLLRCGESPDMREQALALYRSIYADRPELEQLIEGSGITGSRSPRRALRTLDICLALKPGDLLLGRSEEVAAEVTEIDADSCEYTLRTPRGEVSLDADTLGLQYDPVEPNDFRALRQLHPERIAGLIDSDPVALVTGLLHGHHRRLDSEELRNTLVPRYLPAEKWAGWWSKARTLLKRCPNVVLEGRNPIVLTYHNVEQTLESEIEPQWAAADTPMKRFAVIEAYGREARDRHVAIQPALLERMRRDLQRRIDTARTGAPAYALAEALCLDRLNEAAGQADPEKSAAAAIVRAAPDVPALLGGLDDSRLYLKAIEVAKTTQPDNWADTYLRLLPSAPVEACDELAEQLIAVGREEELRAVVSTAAQDFDGCLDAACWMWRSDLGRKLSPLPARELLLRLLEHLGRVSRSDLANSETQRHTRTVIRNTLSHGGYKRYQQVISEMDAGLASTIRTTVERLDGLGHVVRAKLMRIIRDIYPEVGLVRSKVVDPWHDDQTVFCVQQGYDKRKDEIDQLTRVKIPQNAKSVAEAAARGDLSENSEYKFALEERDLLQARLMRMQNEMAAARLLNASDVSTDSVNIGTKVTLAAVDGSDHRSMTILGPFEADAERGIYNYRAPVCARLRGLLIGHTVRLDLGPGEKEYRVVAIENAVQSGAGR